MKVLMFSGIYGKPGRSSLYSDNVALATVAIGSAHVSVNIAESRLVLSTVVTDTVVSSEL